jgi:intermediate peptidase
MKAMTDCNELRQTLSQTQDFPIDTRRQALEILHLLDDISKTVCNVIDAAELCRNVHSSRQWRASAEKAFSILSDYINELNADTRLYQAVTRVIQANDIFPQLSGEEQRFAVLLQAEFERDGIHLPDEPREQVRELRNHLTQIETLFTSNITHSKKFFDVNADAVDTIIPIHVIAGIVPQSNAAEASFAGQENDHTSSTSRLVTLNTDAAVSNTILKYSENPALRKEVFLETVTSCPDNLTVLDAMIQTRHDVSVAMGFSSYADRILRDKMAKNQGNVFAFLHQLQEQVKPHYQTDMAELAKIKQRLEQSSIMEPWDIQYYVGMIKAHEGLESSDISSYLTVTNCIESMKVLVNRLFGIAMEEEDMIPDERWDLDGGSEPPVDARIRKFIFRETSTGRSLGTMYLDLFPRAGKYGHAAHFTVRCGCVLDAVSDSPEYQLPIIALVCNLTPPASSPILSHGEVETLFHEFGHALHSLLSRTAFQHLAGTRTAMDFVETPSHWMEQYVWDPGFLSVLARHYQTGAEIPSEAVQSLVQSRHRFRSLEVQQQLVYAKFDQILFGPPPSTGSRPSTTNIFADLHRQSGMPHADGTYWHTRFGHLVTYGAGYYSYLNAQVFANDIWDHCFAGEDKMQREVGRRLWETVLIHGGAKDPNVMLHDLLGREPKVDSFLSRMGSKPTKQQ